MFIDHDAAIDLNPRACEPVEIGANPRGHDHQIGQQVVGLLEAQAFLTVPRPRWPAGAHWCGPQRHGRCSHCSRPPAAPVRSIMRGRICGAISTTVELCPVGENGVENGKGDKPRPHHDHLRPAVMPLTTPRACSSVQKLWTPCAISPGNRRAHGRRARGNEQVVVLEDRVIVQGQRVAPGCRGSRRAGPDRCHIQLRQARGIGRKHVRFADRALQIVRQHHARSRAVQPTPA